MAVGLPVGQGPGLVWAKSLFQFIQTLSPIYRSAKSASRRGHDDPEGRMILAMQELRKQASHREFAGAVEKI